MHGQDDIAGEERRIAVAISLAIRLSTRESSAAIPYRIDGVPERGGVSAWRAAFGPGTNRLAVAGGVGGGGKERR